MSPWEAEEHRTGTLYTLMDFCCFRIAASIFTTYIIIAWVG
jgi:hypothetical protein